LDLLHGLVPRAASYALLLNPANNNFENQWRDFQAAAHALNVQLHLLRASTENEFDAVFAELARLRAGGLVIGADGVFVSRGEQLGALSLRYKVPAIFQFADFATAGGLVSYGGSLTDSYRQVGIYAARVLKGEKPADLPVQQSARVEMIINLKTAKALGITVPIPLLGRADEVIE
jgi:putative ABC transport system substrate-binding protein